MKSSIKLQQNIKFFIRSNLEGRYVSERWLPYIWYISCIEITMTYTIIVTKSIQKDLDSLPNDIKARVYSNIS